MTSLAMSKSAIHDQVLIARQDLAAVFRIAASLGFHEGTCNHFSLLVPGRADCYLINPFGKHFSEMRASDLLMLDANGNIIEGEGQVEETAFHIHSSIHRANPNAVCVLHTHMPYATAITAMKGGRLLACHQNALRFHGRIAYDDIDEGGYKGLALGSDEGARMVRAMGDKPILFLESHGPLVVGPSVAKAFDDLYFLERAAELQILAMSSGKVLNEIDSAIAHDALQGFVKEAPTYAIAHFEAQKRLLDRTDGTWRD